MAEYYPTTQPLTIIGSKDTSNTRTGIELESTYQAESSTEATKTFETGGYTKLNLDISYTMGGSETSNSIEVKLEGSPDRTNFYQLANDSTSAGTSTITKREFTHVGENGDTSDFSIFLDVAYKYMRISCKETGVSSNKGNVYVEYTLSGR
jgi:hypothetical protein